MEWYTSCSSSSATKAFPPVIPLTLSSEENSLHSSLRCSTIFVPCWTPLASAISKTPELRETMNMNIIYEYMLCSAEKEKHIQCISFSHFLDIKITLIPFPSLPLTRLRTTCIRVHQVQQSGSRRPRGWPPWRQSRIQLQTDQWWCCWPQPGSAVHPKMPEEIIIMTEWVINTIHYKYKSEVMNYLVQPLYRHLQSQF